MKNETFTPYTDLLDAARSILREFENKDAISFVLGFLRYILEERDNMHVELKRMGYKPTYEYAVSPKKGKLESENDVFLYGQKIIAFQTLFFSLITSDAWRLPNATPQENSQLYESRRQLAQALYHAFKNKYLLIPQY